MKKIIPSSVTRKIGRAVLKTKKESPHIFFAGGIAGVVTGTVLACRATLKLEKTLDEIKAEVDNFKGQGVSPKHEGAYRRDLGIIYGQGAVRIARLYGPSVVVGSVSIAALTGAHVQLTRRNTALTVTLAAVSKAYEEYRVRVQEELGQEREREIYNNVDHIAVDGQKELATVSNPSEWSIYARLFDESSPYWKKDAELNRMYIQLQQNYANHLLQARGHLFLNEVYDSLGLERSTEGQVVGWVLNGDGDNYVDFGLQEERCSAFLDGYERSVLLDFNVDGVVHDKI